LLHEKTSKCFLVLTRVLDDATIERKTFQQVKAAEFAGEQEKVSLTFEKTHRKRLISMFRFISFFDFSPSDPLMESEGEEDKA
jgi:hypothetical protein